VFGRTALPVAVGMALTGRPPDGSGGAGYTDAPPTETGEASVSTGLLSFSGGKAALPFYCVCFYPAPIPTGGRAVSCCYSAACSGLENSLLTTASHRWAALWL